MTVSGKCDGVRDLVVDSLVHQMVVGYGYNPYGHYGRGYGPVMDTDEARAPAAAPEAPMAKSAGSAAPRPVEAAPPPSGPSHYTKTNVQERGVDEADIVKTDGKFVYTLRNNELLIAKTWPVDKPDIVARLKFKTLQPQQLYLRGNQIIAQGYATQPRANPYPYGSTRMLVIDASDRARPRLKQIYDIDGGSYNSRVVGDDVYLVQNGALQIPPKLTQIAQKAMTSIPRADQSSLRPWEIQARLAATLKRTLLTSLTQADIAAMLPAIYGPNGKTSLACDQLYMPPNNMQLGLTAIARISLASGKTDLVGATVAGGQVYASTEALYVAAPAYNWNPGLRAVHDADPSVLVARRQAGVRRERQRRWPAAESVLDERAQG